ncbi:MAG: hypothetical protein EOP55_21245, partial [Sphingobacteriales bacterium]
NNVQPKYLIKNLETIKEVDSMDVSENRFGQIMRRPGSTIHDTLQGEVSILSACLKRLSDVIHESEEMEEEVVVVKEKRNAIINNIDITLICEEPKIGRYRELIRDKIANLLHIDRLFVNVKATTTESF